MTITQFTLWLTTVAAAAAAGWAAHHPTLPNGAPSPAGASSASTAGAVRETPLIAVASDGRVTLRVEQQPLEWVLEQIAAQAGLHGLAGTDRSVPAQIVEAPQGPVAAQAADPPSTDPRTTVGHLGPALDRGDEVQRLEALQQAVAHRLPIEERTLTSLYESASSERLRVAAFEAHLESLEDRPDALRAALETGMNVPSAAIQRAATRRLADLDAPEGAEVEETPGVP